MMKKILSSEKIFKISPIVYCMLKLRDLVFLVLGIILGLLIYNFALPQVALPVASAMAVFSPEEGEEIIEFIDSAQESLEIEMYVFTSEEIADALQNAKNRGVDVKIILEKRVTTPDNEKHYNELNDYGIDVRWASTSYQLTHAKFIIVDGKRVLVGSHNFSNAAMRRNREASVILSGSIVEEFKRIFNTDWELAS